MEKCLSKPMHGWSQFIYHNSMRVSYIDSMPYMLLEELIDSIKNKKDFLLVFDAEGYEYTIESSINKKNVLCLLEEKDGIVSFEIEKNFNDFAKKVLISMESDFESWLSFQTINEEEDDENDIERNKLKELIIDLNNLLKI